jgi:hypothetical protein
MRIFLNVGEMRTLPSHSRLTQTGHIKGELLVKLHKNTQPEILEDQGLAVVERFDFAPEHFPNFEGDLYRVRLPEDVTANQAARHLAERADVSYAVPNKVYTLDKTEQKIPDDFSPKLYGLHNTGQGWGKADADIDAPEAWKTTTGSRTGPVIAVLDTGIDLTHPDLKNNLWVNTGEIPGDGLDNDGNGVIDDVHGYNAFDETGDPSEITSHGTHVAGTIAAEGNNGEGVVGVNWQAQIMPIQIFNEKERAPLDSILRGIIYAQKNGARITSNSYGAGGEKNLALEDAFRNSTALHVAAAGNDRSNNDSSPHYPSDYDIPNMISVAATDSRDNLARFSNYGKESVDIAAPGSEIYSTLPRGRYGTKSGTSMATPHVSGAAALLLTEYPEMSNAELKERILSRADKLPSLKGKVASGRLNLAQMLEIDQVAPGQPQGFGPAIEEPHRIQLQWTASGDDAGVGQAASYDLRMSDRPINEDNFDKAQALTPPTPGESGSQQSLDVDFVPWVEAKTVHFALKAIDNLGNSSSLVNTVGEVPAAPAVFHDNFDGQDMGWQAEGTWAKVEEPGRGMVWTDSPDGDTPPSTDMSLISPVISLKDLAKPQLIFETRHIMERYRDQVHVDVSSDGENWKNLSILHDTQEEWNGEEVDLTRFEGQDVQIRFRVKTNYSKSFDGFYLDRVLVTHQPQV